MSIHSYIILTPAPWRTFHLVGGAGYYAGFMHSDGVGSLLTFKKDA